VNSQIKDAAQQYLKASNLLREQGAFSGVVLPLIVNAAFSIELFLKAANSSDIHNLILDDDCYVITAKPNKFGHGLSTLFESLDTRIRQDMSNKYTSEVGGDLTQVLHKYSETFEKIRYIFEDSAAISSIDITELLAVANFMESYAENTLIG